MKIFVFTEYYPIPYKPYYDTQFADLLDKGHEVTVFAQDGVDEVLNERFKAYRLDRRTRRYPTTLRTLGRSLPTLVANGLATPARGLAALRVALHNGKGFKRRLTDWARAVVVQSGKPDLCLIHSLGTGTWFPWLRELFDDVPVAMYYHGGEVPAVANLPQDAVVNVFENVDVVFTNTRFSADHAIGRGCKPSKLVILPVGFALQDYAPDEPREYRRGGLLRLLSAGRMSEEKGFNFALEAIKMLVDRGISDIHYSLTGEGYLRPRLERYVADNGLEPYVTFLGTLTTGGVLRAMRLADVLLLPSIQVGNWVENQACAVQEAMLMKALVVTTQTGGVSESIAPAMKRWSVTPGDPAALADALLDIHALSLDELRALGDGCRRYVAARYDIQKLNSEMLDAALRSR